jgi:hypothetical protein
MQASSFKPQATSLKPQAFQVASSKLQAASSKHQAASLEQRAPRFYSPHKDTRVQKRGTLLKVLGPLQQMLRSQEVKQQDYTLNKKLYITTKLKI